MDKEINRYINRYSIKTPVTLTPIVHSTEGLSTYVCSGCYKSFKNIDTYIQDNNILHCRECIATIESVSSKDNLTDSKHYIRWRSIVSRCTNKKDKRYERYGNRGINLYEEWITDGRAFIKYIETLPNHDKVYSDNYTLDRIDNSKGYIPGNLRWESKQTQVLNQTILKSSNTSGYSGVTKHVLASGKLANPNKPYTARVRIGDGKRINLGYYKTELEGVKARDRYILKNELKHHKTQIIHKL